MGNKKVLGVVDGEVHDAKEEQTGVSRKVSLANTAIYDTAIDALTGHLTVEDVTNGESAIVVATMAAGTVVIGGKVGSADVETAKDNANTLNVYVENGTIQLQNLSGGTIDVVAKIG